MDNLEHHDWWQEWPSEGHNLNYNVSTSNDTAEDYGGLDVADFESFLTQGFSPGMTQSLFSDAQHLGSDASYTQEQLLGAGSFANHGNIDLASAGTHLLDVWPIDLELPPVELLNRPAYNIDVPDMIACETWDLPPSTWGSAAQAPLPSHGEVDSTFWAPGLFAPELDLTDLDAGTRTATPSSLGVEATSSPSGSNTNSPASTSTWRPTPVASEAPCIANGSQEATKVPSDAAAHPTSSSATQSPSSRRPRARPPASSLCCRHPPCTRVFATRKELKRHENSHTRPFKCPIPHCPGDSSTKKGLHRHLWTVHKAYAEREGIPSEKQACPVEGCGKECRGDNLQRHIRLMHKCQ